MGEHAEMSHLDTSVTADLDSMESNAKVSFYVLSVYSRSLGERKFPLYFQNYVVQMKL